MNREAIARTVQEAAKEILPDHYWKSAGMIGDLAADKLLALPPAGGVEEADLGKRLRETWAAYTKAGEPTDYVFRMVARAARAALSPTTLGEES